MFEKGTSVSLPSFEIERQARLERRLVISACVRGTILTFARGLRVLASRGIRLSRDLVTQRLLRGAMRELYRLDDRTLADMGLTRGEIQRQYATECHYVNRVGTVDGSSRPPNPKR